MILGAVKFTIHYCFMDGEAENYFEREGERDRDRDRENQICRGKQGNQIEKDSSWLCCFWFQKFMNLYFITALYSKR